MKYTISADVIEYNGPSGSTAFVLFAVSMPLAAIFLALLGWALYAGFPVWGAVLLGALVLCCGSVAALSVVSFRAARAFRLKIDRKLRLVTTGRGKREKVEQVGEFQSLQIEKSAAIGARSSDEQYHVFLAGALRRMPLGITSLSENGARQKITPLALFLELPVIVLPESIEEAIATAEAAEAPGAEVDAAADAVEEKRECVHA
ncbi:hypothetical protein GCM10027343_37560 [Noviherbaspirillum agri]